MLTQDWAHDKPASHHVASTGPVQSQTPITSQSSRQGCWEGMRPEVEDSTPKAQA